MVSRHAAGEHDLSTFIPEHRHRQVLDSCADVPDESPAFPLPIKGVGISGKTVWVALAENNGGRIPFSARILVNLDADRRGIHMSRIEEAITSLHDKEFNSLPEYGRLLASHILTRQKAGSVSLELTGRLPLVRQAPFSRLNSIDTLEVSFKLVSETGSGRETGHSQVGAEMYHLTACPCTLAYNRKLFGRFHDPWPQATHSQRSRTRLRVTSPAEEQLPSYGDLQDILASVLHISQDLLKRPDETELVLKAHREPQFAEDAVRMVAWAAGEKFKGILSPETRIQVHTLSLESIHIHDVECSLDTRLGDISATLHPTKQE
jgi:GTP cyclohydrolase-4